MKFGHTLFRLDDVDGGGFEKRVLSSGGVPLKRGDQVVGAISAGKQDQAVAEADAAAF